MICLPIITQLYVKHITLFFKLHLWGWFSTNNRKQILAFAILSLKITLAHRRERAVGAFKASTWYEQSCFLWINFENWALIGWHYFRTFGPSLIMDFPEQLLCKISKNNHWILSIFNLASKKVFHSIDCLKFVRNCYEKFFVLENFLAKILN